MFIDNITPTVELNALAMKRGEHTMYTIIEIPQYLTTPPLPPSTLYNNGFRHDTYSQYNNFNNIV